MRTSLVASRTAFFIASSVALLGRAHPAAAAETGAAAARSARAESPPSAPRPSSGHAHAAAPSGATVLRMTSTWADTQLFEHLGTTFGQGYVGGRPASITTVYLRKVCELPCAAPLRADGDYFVDAPGMRTQRLRIPSSGGPAEATVKGAPVWPVYLSIAGIAVGGSLTLLGSLLWISSSRAGAYPVVTLFGLAALGASSAGLVLAPRTEITSAAGEKLTRRSPLRLSGAGLMF